MISLCFGLYSLTLTYIHCFLFVTVHAHYIEYSIQNIPKFNNKMLKTHFFFGIRINPLESHRFYISYTNNY